MNTQQADEPVLDDNTLQSIMHRIDAEGLELLGPNGVLKGLTKKIMEAALDAERPEHLGYERGDPGGRGSGKSRNGAPTSWLTDSIERPMPSATTTWSISSSHATQCS